ncbi:ATP-binding response regulator [Flavobacterium sp. W20_MBD1_R3]|uniref:ATP-binding response regulator n=1 Tax=Flavobacterium sp. W20_MBD1_R3 TaxID=3240278 RepID=UPI003F8FB82E
MDNKKSYIPIKVFISYLVLVLLFGSVGWFLYTENKNFSTAEEIITNENNTVLMVSNLLSNTYETENSARIAIQTETEKDFEIYIQKNIALKADIDSLKMFVSTPHQITLLDSVKQLLSRKTINIQQLKLIKNKTENEDAVNEAINDLTRMESSLRKLQLEDFVEYPSRMGNYQRNVLKDYVAYLNQNIPDDRTNTLSKKATDSILLVSKNLLSEVKKETSRKKKLLNFEENKLLQNELSISDQLRKVLIIIEREIIINTTKDYVDRQNSLTKTNKIVFTAAIIGLLLTLFFLILILSDYSKTQSYKKQLEVANFKTKKLLLSREQLIATVSHDLKTPLSTIIGYTELLSNSTLNNKQNYYVKNIKGSSDYITQLVRDLLDLTQIEAGKISVEKIPFSLCDMINQVGNSIQSVHSHKPIQLIIDIDPNLENRIIGDPFRLRQIISNLIGNAFKFTEEGYIKITAKIQYEAQLILIQIEDSGIGIATKNQQLIFEEFTQADENIEKKYGGTGLGLTISKKIAAILGGDLYLKSELGEGSLFTLQIPLQFYTVVLDKQNNANLTKQKYTAIVIDDDESLLRLTSEVLKQNHYTVFPFTNAKEALNALSNIDFDFIITDIQMPMIDGFLFLKELIKNTKYQYKNQPVIAVTGKNDVNIEHYKKAGFITIVSKPYSPKILLKTLQSILDNDDIPLEKNLKNKTIKSSGPYSLKALQAFLSNDQEALKEVLVQFIKATAENLENLDQAVSNTNFAEIKHTAHKMGPMFKQINASEISVILDTLELKDLAKEEVGVASINLKLKIRSLFILLEKEII